MNIEKGIANYKFIYSCVLGDKSHMNTAGKIVFFIPAIFLIGLYGTIEFLFDKELS